MKTMPVIAIVALAMAAIFVGESFGSPTVRDVCTDCGTYGDNVISTMVSAEKDEEPSNPRFYCPLIKGVLALLFKSGTYSYATVIGKKIAVATYTNDQFWITDNEKHYKVYFATDNVISVRGRGTDVEKILIEEKQANKAVLIIFKMDIPHNVVPTCLPLPGQINVNIGQKFIIPFDTISPNNDISINNKELSVLEDKSSTILLKVTLTPEQRSKTVPSGASVTIDVNGRKVLVGCMEKQQAAGRGKVIPYIAVLYKNVALDWIASQAAAMKERVCSPAVYDKHQTKAYGH